MRKIRMILSLLLLAASVVAFGGYKIYFERMQDVTPPVLTVPEDTLAVSVYASDEELLAGVTAQDDRDGDLTESVFVELVDKFDEDMTRLVTYAVADKAGNVTKGSRKLQYTDYSSPKFSMTGPLNFYAGADDLTQTIGANDVVDGDLSSKVRISQTYQLKEKGGDYPMEFYVTNSMGDVSRFTATVTLFEDITEMYAPVVELEQYLVYADAAHPVDYWSNLKSLKINNFPYVRSGDFLVPDVEEFHQSSLPEVISREEVRIDSNVDYQTPGCYEVLYRFTWGEYTGRVRLVVIVA